MLIISAIGRLLCAAIELSRRGNTVEDLHQPAYSPGSFYDSVRVGLARQDEGVENFGVTRTIGCLIRIIDTRLVSNRRAALAIRSSFSRDLDGVIRVGRLLSSRYQ